MKTEQQNTPVSIVIPTWNGRELLKRFLPSVVDALAAWPGGGEIVVADDGGSDGTPEFLAAEFPALKVVRSKVNRGFAGAANMGMTAARNRITVLLNNDVEVDKKFLEPLVRWFGNAKIFAVCARSLDWDHRTFRDGGKAGYWKRGFWRVWRNYEVVRQQQTPPESWPSIYGSGGFTAFDRDKWLALGGLDEMFAPFNWEDTDICYRALKRGWSVLYEPESVVYHSPNTTIGGTSHRLRVRFISRRNRLLFHWKNLTDSRMLAGNICYCCLSLPLALLRLDFATAAAFFAAVWRLREVVARRKVEKREAVVCDSAIRREFRALEVRIAANSQGRLE